MCVNRPGFYYPANFKSNYGVNAALVDSAKFVSSKPTTPLSPTKPKGSRIVKLIRNLRGHL